MNHLAQPVVLLSVLCVLLFTLEPASGLVPSVFLHTRADGEQIFGKCTLDQVLGMFLDYPETCAQALEKVSAELRSGTATVDTLTELYQTACKEECIKPIQEFGSICEAEESVQLILSSCKGDISSGDICVLSLIKNDGMTAAEECDKAIKANTCRPECRDSLLQLKQDIGCCVNSIFNVTTYGYDSLNIADYKLWSLCELTTPTFCDADSDLLGSSSIIPSVSFITVLMLLIMVYFL